MKDVAVIGVPHDKWGESVHAVVVLHQQAHQHQRGCEAGAEVEAGMEADLKDWCKARMAGFKCLQSIVFMADADMPRTATGKTQPTVVQSRRQQKMRPWINLPQLTQLTQLTLPTLPMRKSNRRCSPWCASAGLFPAPARQRLPGRCRPTRGAGSCRACETWLRAWRKLACWIFRRAGNQCRPKGRGTGHPGSPAF